MELACDAPELPPPLTRVPVQTARRRRPAGWLCTVGVVGLVVLAIAIGYPRGGAVVFGFVVLVPIERLFRRHEQPVFRPGLRADVVHLLVSGALLIGAVLVPVALWSVLLRPFLDNPVALAFRSQPAWLIAFEAFLGAQLLTYWVHRLGHEVPVLWRLHQVHHSSERLDWIAGARIHPLEGLVAGAVLGAPLLLLGVQPGMLGALEVVTQLWAVTLHLNVRWRLRFLDGIWATTEFHHWHHSSEPEAINHNYAGMLPVLDKIFGTYRMPSDRRPQVYGIGRDVPDGYLAQLAMPFRRTAEVDRRDLGAPAHLR